MSAAVERDPDGRPAFAVTMIENITNRKRAEVELMRQAELSERQALHDPLTDLPNRLLFADRIEQAIVQSERYGTRAAVLMMDLDRFKEVNDSLGHRAGDELLKEVAERLRGATRASDTAARLGGDEFGLLLPDLAEGDSVLTMIDRIRDAFAQPIFVHDLPLAIEASIGIAVFPDHGTLGRAADPARRHGHVQRQARAARRSTSTTTSADDHDPNRLTLVAELRARDGGARARPALPAEGGAGRRRSAPRSRRSCAGSTRRGD